MQILDLIYGYVFVFVVIVDYGHIGNGRKIRTFLEVRITLVEIKSYAELFVLV